MSRTHSFPHMQVPAYVQSGPGGKELNRVAVADAALAVTTRRLDGHADNIPLPGPLGFRCQMQDLRGGPDLPLGALSQGPVQHFGRRVNGLATRLDFLDTRPWHRGLKTVHFSCHRQCKPGLGGVQADVFRGIPMVPEVFLTGRSPTLPVVFFVVAPRLV